MPDVGGTNFPYSEEGVTKAKAWAEMTGKPIKMHGKYYRGGDIPMYGLGGWLKKKAKKVKKWSKKTMTPPKALRESALGKGLTKVAKKTKKMYTPPKAVREFAKRAVTPPKAVRESKAGRWLGGAGRKLHKTFLNPAGLERTLDKWGNPAGAGRWWNRNVKPLGNLKFNDLNPYNKSDSDMPDPSYGADANMFGARQRFGGGSDISGQMAELMGELGGEVPAGRRMYGTSKKKRR
tara:strand:- start:1197 stop:1901 length:705 start_codon:yes stop_codon:yes gene_type:complete